MFTGVSSMPDSQPSVEEAAASSSSSSPSPHPAGENGSQEDASFGRVMVFVVDSRGKCSGLLHKALG